ncbi:aryl-alcohol-oxidase from pleurotus Eryingii [Gloeopeniophorella convolvens]|nr:aryl-alcohol-oxidase from pleurotus Eryingii [Gloeopeniophorella convolvens]
MQAFVLSVLALTTPSVYAALYDSPASLPNRQYDYIIVGAGAGGSVLANRLSASSSNTVLVIEAGVSDDANPNIQIPFLCTTLANSNVDWNYTTVPQVGLNNRVVDYPRGKTLGGSTSISEHSVRLTRIDYMVWTRGPTDDYDRWAKVSGDLGWSWNSMRSIVKSIEKLVPPADGHDTTGQIIPSIHGTSGPVEISVQGFPSDLDSRVFRTTAELPAEFPFNEDVNSGNPLGISWNQFAVGGGVRTSASTAYLRPALSRPNLDVLINTQVTKVIRTGTNHGLPVFLGVQFAQNANSQLYALNATKEVIVSAGAVNTPQLLMLSGIGDFNELSGLGIKTIVNSPRVGKNLQDHVVLPNVWSVNATFTYDDITRDPAILEADIAEWVANKTGPFATSPNEEIGWLRLPRSSSIFRTVPDPSSGPHSPHYEFLFAESFASFVESPPATGHYMMIASNLVTPTSRGSITLQSSNPWQAPLIDPALLNSDFDIFAIREGIKSALRFAAASAWDGYVIGPYGDLATANTDDELEAYARRNAATVFHPVGTAAMAAKDSSNGVVNPDLTVKGAVGLRVVDASVFPFIPTAHPQSAIYAFAERAAKLILSSSHPGGNGALQY